MRGGLIGAGSSGEGPPDSVSGAQQHEREAPSSKAYLGAREDPDLGDPFAIPAVTVTLAISAPRFRSMRTAVTVSRPTKSWPSDLIAALLNRTEIWTLIRSLSSGRYLGPGASG